MSDEFAAFSLEGEIPEDVEAGDPGHPELHNAVLAILREIDTMIDSGEFDGEQGPQGPEGPAGADGEDGASAYEIAVDEGFEGTEEEWLASLEGEQGPQGPEGPQGPQGPAGEDGADGFPTEAQWNDLVGRVDDLEDSLNGGN